jgi:hypothetical protein
MARDLFPEVETIISSSNPYIRRKAALCAMRICRKVPDLQEHFLEKAKLLLQDRNHGVLLCGITLVANLCEADEAEDDENGVRDIFKPVVPSLVKILKGLSSSGYAPEHDVTGITDPFLQCKILQLLRVLARGDASVSEQINDILAQVCYATFSRVRSLILAGCYQYRLLEERRKLHPLRSSTYHSRHRGRLWSSRAWCEHSRQILVKSRQQHSIRCAQHFDQGRCRRAQCCSATQKHNFGLLAGSRHQYSKKSSRPQFHIDQ